MRVNRAELLQQLESVAAGLAQREIVEQSTCFVFSNGSIHTFNDEISCSAKSPLKSVEGAVRAQQFMTLLGKLAEDDIDIAQGEGELIVKAAKGRKAGIKMEAEVMLPVDSVESADEWKPLHEEFGEAAGIVSQCAGKDESHFVLTCVHIHPNYLEACDNSQAIRYPLSTGLEKDSLVRRDSLQKVIALDMTEFSETEAWLHFRNPGGLTLSCRRWLDDYPNLDDVLSATGTPTTLPGGLSEAIEKAVIFSADNPQADAVKIELKEGRLRIRGEGVGGWYTEVVQVKYDGPSASFMIAPGLLSSITKRSNEVEIGGDRLAIDGGKFKFVSCLGKA